MGSASPITIAFDTETTLLRFRGKACTSLVPRLVCMTWAWRDAGGRMRSGITSDPVRALDLWRGWLRAEGVSLVGQNVAFDVAVMLRAATDAGAALSEVMAEVMDAYERSEVADTKVREQLMAIADGSFGTRKFSLADLEARYLAIDRSDQKKAAAGAPDPWRLRYQELAPYPVEQWPEAAVRYALEDAEGTLRVYEAQEADAPPPTSAAFQTMAALSLHLAGAWGLRVDGAWARGLDDEYSAAQLDAQEDLIRLGLMRECGTLDTQAVRELVARLYASIGKDAPTTPAGEIQADKRAMRDLERAGVKDEAFAVLGRYKQAQKFRSTYIEPVLDAAEGAGALCPSYQVLVESGRTSCARPNIQNIPGRGPGARLRGSFVPRPGNVFLQADYSTLELRTLAQTCLNFGIPSRMADALREGRDLHLDFAAKTMRIPYAEAAERLAAGDKEMKHRRTLSKIANFGYAGGMGAFSFISYAAGMGVEISEGEATSLRDGWFEAWPEMRVYFEAISARQTPAGEYVLEQHGPHGATSVWRRRVCDSFTSACNTLFQGLAADLVKLALWRVTKVCYADQSSPLYGFRAPIMVHDELILEGPAHRASEALAELQRVMISAGEVFTPDVPMEAEGMVMEERWTKS